MATVYTVSTLSDGVYDVVGSINMALDVVESVANTEEWSFVRTRYEHEIKRHGAALIPDEGGGSHIIQRWKVRTY